MIKRVGIKFDMVMFLCIVSLLIIGTIFVFSTSFYKSIVSDAGVSGLFESEVKHIVMGLIAMIVMYKLTYKVFDSRLAYVFFAVAVFLLILVLIAGKEVNGGRRWIPIGSFTFMPSEVMRLACVILFAKVLSTKKNIDSFFGDIVPLMMIIAVVAAPIMMQPNMSTASILALSMIAIMFFAGMRWKHIGILSIPIISLFALMIIKEPYRLERYMSYLDPFSDPLGSGYQVINSLCAFSLGGIDGVGLGNGIMNKEFIPEPHNDFIFATIGEEVGFLGCLIMIMLFVTLIYRGYRTALSCDDKFSFYLAAGLTTSVAIQFLINLCVTLSIVPVTGLALPFISYGGTNIIMLLAGMGLLLSISGEKGIKNNGSGE